MEYIKNNELIKDEIYYVSTDNYWIIGKVTLPNNGDNNGLNLRGNATYISKKEDFKIDKSWCYKASDRTYRLATPEEKHWLNTCMEQDKFITFEEAMKTFIPEYVEYINTYDTSWKFGKIYKVDEGGKVNFESGAKSFNSSHSRNPTLFKPSTKEAYDAQFVVIEPLPQFKVIESIETITKVENNEGNQFFIGDTVIGSKTKIKSKIISFKYNVDKTAILAITDKTPNIGIGINHLEHYIEPKVEETLLEKAKRLYPVGTKFINPNGNKECVIKEKGDYFKGNNNNIYHSLKSGIYKYDEGLSGCIYMNNTWSKIIE